MDHTKSLTSLLLLIGLITIVSTSCNRSKSEITETKTMKINWTKLSTEGLQENLSKGVSASYAALLNGNLIVAGGANFPGKLGFEGGSKAFYNEVLIYEKSTAEWKVINNLPSAIAYGVSVPLSDGALWIGGNNDEKSFDTTYYVSITSKNVVVIKPFVSLPVTMDNFSGCSIGDMVFVAGGVENGKPSNSIYSINIKTDNEWTKLADFPGIPRVQPVLSSAEINGIIYVYLMGGFFGGDENQKPAMATDILKYDVSSEQWSVDGEQIDPETKKPFSLGGATAMTFENRYIICLGGVNHDIFLDAITTQYNIAYDSELSVDEKRDKNLEFSKFYMTQPVEYYKFNTECRVYDTQTRECSVIDNTNDAAHAGATLVFEGNQFYVVQGELKPGVRSAYTFKGEIK